MKHLIAALLICLLLCGCAREIPEETISPTEESIPIITTSPEGLYDAGSELEIRYNGAVRAYPLNRSDTRGMLAFGGGVLVFSGEETTTLTLLTGDMLSPSAGIQLDFFLSPDDPSVVVSGRILSYYDPVNRETVVLDDSLKVVSRIAAPEDLSGVPVLSEDRNALYYCTETTLRAWDLESGIRRTLKEMAYPGQSVTGVHWGGKIVQCKTEESNLFLSTEDGRLEEEWTGEITLLSTDSTFCAALELGLNPALVYCSAGSPKLLLPEEGYGEYFCLQGGLGAVLVTLPSAEEVRFAYYDLTTGTRRSVLSVPSEHYPSAIAADDDGFVYILTYDAAYGCSTVYRWDTASLAANDATVYAGDYATEEAPLADQLALCQRYAQELGEKYGIQILIGKAAAEVQPWDFDLEAETQPALILQELALLDQRLADYPEGMLADTASNFASLKLCLVRSVTGSAESGSLNTATGVQFMDGSDAYVAISVGKFARQALYHELFHAMETHILNYSIAFDQWETLNPAGFDYDYSYAANESRDSGIYLQPEYRAFIDTYSMSFPKEDRARVMEYAMMDGNKELFEAPGLQEKLKALCEGIREAYGLEKAEETFLWEQYLD